jgi:DNA-directed RNA polymerase subunit RPC12/RpoP
MSVFQKQRPKKVTYQRGQVTCRKCGAPIFVYKLATLPDEFSVHCTKCSGRSLYQNREIAIQEFPERRKKPRK